MDIIILILTFNEEIHLRRCIKSCFPVTKSIVVIDSFSIDKTVSMAQEMGVRVLQRKFDNHANQINWALNKLRGEAKWIMRVDADEIISDHLSSELIRELPKISDEVKGINVNRNIIFLDKIIRFGGCYKRKTMRIVKPENAFCEKRLMDEHLVVNGKIVNFKGSIYDYSLKPLSFWINKHNTYSNKEAAEMLNLVRKNKNVISKANKKSLPISVLIKKN